MKYAIGLHIMNIESDWDRRPFFTSKLNEMREIVSEMAKVQKEQVRVVVSPYRICPLGAHIDHQGGTVLAMTIDKGTLLGFTPSESDQFVIRSGQFQGKVKFQAPRRNCCRVHHTKKKGPFGADSS